MRLAVVVLLGFLGWPASSSVAQSNRGEQACLYSFSVGGRPLQIGACSSDDPLGFAKNPDVARVQRALGIRPESVRFAGCERDVFSTFEESSGAASTARYTITYPVSAREGFLAPITHELSHVIQIEMAGSLKMLQDNFESLRIELGADFLTGIVFANTFKGIDLGEFQHNLSLMGLYREPTSKAHGSPSQRTSAFRRGVFFRFESVSMSFRKASEEFQANIYAELQ